MPVDPATWTCPAPLATHDRVVLGHGGGGRLSADLLEHLLLPCFGEAAADLELADAAVLDLAGATVAFTTDGFVVQPLRFPGGSIGHLAVNGTVNDLAMRGAVPVAVTVAMILEEGLSLAELASVATDLGEAAARVPVPIVAGDTKVVGAGQADGMYLTTAGVGLVPPGIDIGPHRATPGDVVLVSGPIGEHGIAVLSERDDLGFGTEVRSDTAALSGLVASVLAAWPDVHVLRDPTRGGLAATLCELATAAGVGVEIDETAVPVPTPVATACGMLGLDPLHLACEGRLVAMVPAAGVDTVLAALRAHEQGREAVVVGEVTAGHQGVVAERTAFGGTRIIEPPMGEHLPRIC